MQGTPMAPLARLQTYQFFPHYSFPSRAWPNPPPAACLTPILGLNLAGTMGRHCNLLEGQKEIINQSQNTPPKKCVSIAQNTPKKGVSP